MSEIFFSAQELYNSPNLSNKEIFLILVQRLSIHFELKIVPDPPIGSQGMQFIINNKIVSTTFVSEDLSSDMSDYIFYEDCNLAIKTIFNVQANKVILENDPQRRNI